MDELWMLSIHGHNFYGLWNFRLCTNSLVGQCPVGHPWRENQIIIKTNTLFGSHSNGPVCLNFFGRVVIECGNNLLKRSHFPRMILSKLFWKSDEQVVLFFFFWFSNWWKMFGAYIYVLSIAQDVTIASKVHKMLIFWLEDVLFFGHHKIRKSYS